MAAVPTDSMMLSLAILWTLTLSRDVVTFIFSYEFQCRWQISKLWWRERTALIWKRKVPLNKIRYDFQIILSSSVCTMQLVTTMGPSLVAMPVWLGRVCVCVCVCADVSRNYASLKLSSFSFPDSFYISQSYSFSHWSLAESLPCPVFSHFLSIYSPRNCPHWCYQSSLKSFHSSPSSGPLLPSYLCS